MNEIEDMYFEGYPSMIDSDVVLKFEDDDDSKGYKHFGKLNEFYTDGKIMSIVAEFDDFYVFGVFDFNKKLIVGEKCKKYVDAKRLFMESQK